MARRGAPEVNAGSMADIAFLLLIFFLVTTTIGVDQGINRLLPRYEENPPVPPINERNILTVLVNKDNQLLVEEKLVDIKDLRQTAIDFLENNLETVSVPTTFRHFETSRDLHVEITFRISLWICQSEIDLSRAPTFHKGQSQHKTNGWP